MIIKIDSREKLPLPFTPIKGLISKVLTIGLPFGDYWAEREDGSEFPIVFERKSIPDLFGTLTNQDGLRRHKAKIQKAKDADVWFYLIIDGTLDEVLAGAQYSEVHPSVLIKTVFTFMVKYGLHPIFCQDEEEMMRFMIETWYAWGKNFKSNKQEAQ